MKVSPAAGALAACLAAAAPSAALADPPLALSDLVGQLRKNAAAAMAKYEAHVPMRLQSSGLTLQKDDSATCDQPSGSGGYATGKAATVTFRMELPDWMQVRASFCREQAKGFFSELGDDRPFVADCRITGVEPYFDGRLVRLDCLSPRRAPASLTAAEKAAIRDQVSRCWRMPEGGPEGVSVAIRVALGPDGAVAAAEIRDADRYAADASFRAAADAARRAVLECGPIRGPAEKYEEWKTVSFAFGPRGAAASSAAPEPGKAMAKGRTGYVAVENPAPALVPPAAGAPLARQVTVAETPQYQIFMATDRSFGIVLTDRNLSAARERAEGELLARLKLAREQACRLAVSVAVPRAVSPPASGVDYRLSFCPDGKPLPR